MSHTILLTGGAGFIGSHLTRLFVTKYPDYKIVNIDKLTYAGNLENLTDIENRPNYQFVKDRFLEKYNVEISRLKKAIAMYEDKIAAIEDYKEDAKC